MTWKLAFPSAIADRSKAIQVFAKIVKAGLVIGATGRSELWFGIVIEQRPPLLSQVKLLLRDVHPAVWRRV